MVLLLALFNLSYRIGRESVGQWDESLYATSAWEMNKGPYSVATTRDGQLDYYNSKPPLNAWLIATSFRALGTNLVALRVPSVVAAWLTVVLLQWWVGRMFGTVQAVLASLVLATGFAFIHEHAGRSGNADAPFTLLVTVVVALAWLSQRHPWAVAWLGPTLGAIFLLKGPAVLLPLLCLVGFKVLCRHRVRWAAGPVCVAVVAFGLSVGGWGYARYALDGRQFFAAMLENDLWGVTATHLEGHVQGPLFYLNVLQRYHYEWLVPIAIAAVVCRRAWPIVGRHILASIRDREPVTVLMICWFVATFVLPSVMQTRITWYLNSFYPLGAILCGLLFEHAGRSVGRARLAEAFVLTVCLAVVVAESKSLWRLHRVTNLDTSVQGVLREHARRTGHIRVFRDKHYENEAFYVRAVLGGEFSVRDRERPRHRFRSGDLVVTASERPEAGLVLSAVADGHRIYVVP